MMLVVGPYKFYLDQGGQLRVTADMPEGPAQSIVVPYDHVPDFFRFMDMAEQLCAYARRGGQLAQPANPAP